MSEIALELDGIENFTGTESYHRINLFGYEVNATDGVTYVMDNGYSWAVTDALIVVAMKKLRNEDFLTIELKVKEGTHDGEKYKAVVEITDGNGKVFNRQYYSLTDARRGWKMYLTDGVIMLSGEY